MRVSEGVTLTTVNAHPDAGFPKTFTDVRAVSEGVMVDAKLEASSPSTNPKPTPTPTPTPTPGPLLSITPQSLALWYTTSRVPSNPTAVLETGTATPSTQTSNTVGALLITHVSSNTSVTRNGPFSKAPQTLRTSSGDMMSQAMPCMVAMACTKPLSMSFPVLNKLRCTSPWYGR
jgi:hypothetical protein